MDKLQAAEQLRKAIQMFAATLTDEQAMQIAAVYDTFVIGKSYAEGEIFSYGTNEVGDPQLYRVAQAHTSQEQWLSDANSALYTPIGLDDQGYPIWSKPSGAHDAYNSGDIVNYNGTLYLSKIDGNVWSPDENPSGWEKVEG